MLELRHLRYFIAVAEERHFGRAAERLGIAQPGLSQQIKGLERTLGVSLFVRDKRRVDITEAGSVFLEHAQLVMELMDRAKRSTKLVTKGKKGLVRVGTSLSGLVPVAKRLLEEFRIRHPDVELEITPGFGPPTVEALHRRSLDAAILLTPFRSIEGMRHLSLGGIELIVALPEGHRLAEFERIPREELRKESFVEWPSRMNPPLRAHIQDLIFGDGPPKQTVEATEFSESARLLMVSRGMGVAAMLPMTAELGIPGVVFGRLEDPPPLLEFHLAWFDTHASVYTEVFIDLARELTAARDSADPTGSGDPAVP